MPCPRGKIKRDSYTRKSSSGKTIKVSSNCIKAQSQSGKKRSDIDKKIVAQQDREHAEARRRFGTPPCPTGHVIREGFNRDGTWVAPTCIKAKGLSKKTGVKGKKLFRLNSGTLGQFGYENIKNLSQKKRRSSLKKAMKHIKPLSVQRKLNAVAILQKNTNPEVTEILQKDIEWVKGTREYKNRNT